MEIRLAQAQDIDAWMALAEQVRDVFPGLETAEAMEEHRATVLRFIKNASAVCGAEADRMAGILLFSRESGQLCSWRWTPPTEGSILPDRWCP